MPLKGLNRFRSGKRRYGRPLYLKTHYKSACCVCEPEEAPYKLISLIDYEREKGITRKKAISLLKFHKLLCLWHKGRYWVAENPENPPTEYDFEHRLRRSRKRRKSRGTYKSESDYYGSENFIRNSEEDARQLKKNQSTP